MANDVIRRLRCACGWEASGKFEELVLEAQEHGRRIHNMAPTREEVEAMLLPLEGASWEHRAQPGDTRSRST
jgi:hypothetical protein